MRTYLAEYSELEGQQITMALRRTVPLERDLIHLAQQLLVRYKAGPRENLVASEADMQQLPDSQLA